MNVTDNSLCLVNKKKMKKKHSPAKGYTDGACNIGLTSGNDALWVSKNPIVFSSHLYLSLPLHLGSSLAPSLHISYDN